MTSRQYVNMILDHGSKLIARKDEFEIPAINSLKGRVAVRVHNTGTDAKGETRNYKSKAYKTRFKKNDPVSMQQTGDLRRDYEGGSYKNKGDNVLGFRMNKTSDSKGKTKAGSVDKILGEEARRNGKLYSLTDDEIKDFRRQLIRFINRIQKKFLNV